MNPVNVTREVMRGFSDSTWTQHNTWKRAWPRPFIVGRGEAAVWCVDVKKLHKHRWGFTTGWFHNWKQGITPIASIHTYRFFLWSRTCSLRDYYRQREKKEKRERNHSTFSACQREIIHQTRPRLVSVDNKRQAVRFTTLTKRLVTWADRGLSGVLTWLSGSSQTSKPAVVCLSGPRSPAAQPQPPPSRLYISVLTLWRLRGEALVAFEVFTSWTKPFRDGVGVGDFDDWGFCGIFQVREQRGRKTPRTRVCLQERLEMEKHLHVVCAQYDHRDVGSALVRS